MFDKINLATEFSNALATFLRFSHFTPKSKVQNTLQVLHLIFPWLSSFRIESDGNLRWLARSDFNDDVVHSRLSAAERQVRDWVIEYVDGQRVDAAGGER